jgi:GntR family transcriptional regulator, transcriptional repressor for pyruvate dehydrogenase complex
MINAKDDIILGSSILVAGRLRRFIQERKLSPGDRLPTHNELSRRLKIGLRRLREGLSILEQQGLIKTNRKAGTSVAEPSIDLLTDPIGWHLELMGYTFPDLVKARASLESGAAADAARERSARDVLVMLDAIEQMEDLTAQGQCDNEPDEAFHLAILAATHNPVMLIFGRLIAAQFHRKGREHLDLSIPRQKEGIAEHRAILKALEGRKSDLAGSLMYRHVILQLNFMENQKGSS